MATGTISIIATVVVGFAGSFGLNHKRRKDKQRRVRKGVRAEVETVRHRLKGWSKSIIEHDETGTPVYDTDPTSHTIYEGLSSEIGLLSDEEVEVLTKFYSRCNQLSEQQRSVSLTDEPSALTQHTMLRNVIQLNRQANEVLTLLEENIPSLDPDESRYCPDLNSEEVDDIVRERMGAISKMSAEKRD